MSTIASTGTWNLDTVHSTASFAVKHMGVSNYRTSFKAIEATVELDGGDAKLVGKVPVESIDVADEMLRGHLLSPDFFNAEQTPTITFRSTDIRLADDGTVEVDGDLTIKGITKPVTAKGSYGVGIGIAGNEVVGLDLEAPIDRRDYGIAWQAELPKGGDVLAWDVTIQAHLELAKA
jgi:polyisoprenoid-binding protein YceI